jgi:small subunit ribosomal protein S1
MSNPNASEFQNHSEPSESFDGLLSQFERSHARKKQEGSSQIEGTVIAVSADSIFLDVGYKTEGVLPLSP